MEVRILSPAFIHSVIAWISEPNLFVAAGDKSLTRSGGLAFRHPRLTRLGDR
jgi:hypothetical protein